MWRICRSVAPLAGAWIEIKSKTLKQCPSAVAPLAGAWIEISPCSALSVSGAVAPLAGAWIEMSDGSPSTSLPKGRSPRGSVD